MGNMFGDGSESLPAWVSEEEQQPFLYVSNQDITDLLALSLAGVLSLLGVTCIAFGSGWCQILFLQAGQGAAPDAAVVGTHCSLLKLLGCTALIGMRIFLPLYIMGGGYYSCGQTLARATVAYLADQPFIEWLIR